VNRLRLNRLPSSFYEVSSELVRGLQRALFRVKNNPRNVAPRTVVESDFLNGYTMVSNDGADRVRVAINVEPLLDMSSNLALTHWDASAPAVGLILQGGCRQSKRPYPSSVARATLATVKPPRNRRTRLREDV